MKYMIMMFGGLGTSLADRSPEWIKEMTVENPVGLHLAFDVDPVTFDQILARLHANGVPYGSEPDEPDNGRTDHPLCPRGLYFIDDARNLYELMSPA